MIKHEASPGERFAKYFPSIGQTVWAMAEKKLKFIITEDLLVRKSSDYLFYQTEVTALTISDEKILLKLAESNEKSIQAAIVLNPSVSSAVLDKILDKCEPRVVQIILENKEFLTKEQIEKVLKNRNFGVRSLAQNYIQTGKIKMHAIH